MPIKMMSDCTLAIIGYGNIGKECAKKAFLGFGTRVIGVKRDPTSVDEESL